MADDLKTVPFRYIASEDTVFSVQNYGEPVVTLHGDGRLEVNPKYSMDEAAKVFWEAVESARRWDGVERRKPLHAHRDSNEKCADCPEGYPV